MADNRTMKTARAAVVSLAAALMLAGALASTGRAAAQPLAHRTTIATDVLIVGGSPSGVAAAVASARQGRRVVLIEPRPYLGTVLTAAMLNVFDVNWVNGRSVIDGIYAEIFAELDLTFDPLRARTVLARKIGAEKQITLMVSTDALHPLLGEDGVEGVAVRSRNGRTILLRAAVTIDATDDADVAAAAGARYALGREDSAADTRMQPATLMFKVDGVRWSHLTGFVRNDSCVRPAGVRFGYAWGFSCVLDRYHPQDARIGLESLNIGRVTNGSAWVNGLRIYGVDGTKQHSRHEGRNVAAREVPHVIRYFQRSLPGFAHARMTELAPELYVRESRHVSGLYRLTAHDVVGGRLFWDRVAVASYPLDIHPYYPGWVNPYPPTRRAYSIPLRALVPERLDGLLVASRAFSATSHAAGSARVVPVGMALGEAAGVVAAVAVERNVGLHHLARSKPLVSEVQRRLRTQGARIDLLFSGGQSSATDPLSRARRPGRGGY